MTELHMTDDIATLIQEGQAALLAGDTYEARQRFRRVVEIDPSNVAGWIGLAGAVRPYKEKQQYLQRALELDQTSTEARASLDYVEAKLAVGEILAPRGVSTPVEDPLLASFRESHKQEADALDLTSNPATDIEYCYIHPDRETGLRCTQCERPICAECMVRAPVGQLCPECARARRPRNYQVSAGNLAVAGLIGIVGSFIANFVAAQFLFMLGFFAFFLAFILAPMVGELFVRLLDRVTHGKRGKEMQVTVGIGIALGAAPLLLLTLLAGGFPLLSLFFIIMMMMTVIARLR